MIDVASVRTSGILRMPSEEITIQVEPELARAYRAASGSLEDLMREVSREALSHGLTPEVLESILREP